MSTARGPSNAPPAGAGTPPGRDARPGRRPVPLIRAAMEVITLLMICAAPWAYGAVHPGFEFLLDAGVGLLLLLWAARMLLEGHLTWKKCPVAVCLAGLFCLGAWQLTSLPRPTLARLSPAASRLYGQLLPERPEVLPGGEGPAAVSPPAGSTISLYPGATRKELFRILAVILVFAVVRNNFATPAALKRLSVVALVNGALLSLFALAQFFTSPHNVLYWSYPSQGEAFGPFINRNHFPFYLNLCIGLGVGLLVSRGLRGPEGGRDKGPSGGGQRGARPGHMAGLAGAARGRLEFLFGPLHDSPSLWVCAALALMVSSVLFCLSRGGLLALVGGGLVGALVARLRLSRSFRLGTGPLLIGALTLGLISWFGLGLVKARVATLWKHEALESRLPLWRHCLPIVADFPLWGTGFGTFDFVEPLYRDEEAGSSANLSYGHAHNDYLELLVEGGALGLGLGLLAVGAVYRLGFRAVGLHRGRPAAGLALGALIAFTTLVVHGFGEFGTHVPAITLLAAVVCAHLCALGSAPAPEGAGAGPASAGEYRFRLWGLVPAAGAATAASLGLVLCAAGWRAHRVDRLQEAAFRAPGEDQLHDRIAYLARAAALAPDDARAQLELAYARDRLFEWQTGPDQQDGAPERPLLTQVLRAFLQARDACPLLSDAHLGVASHARKLERGDTQEDYLRRVKLLAPCDPERWYLCGLQEFKGGHPEQAWASWRRSLELSEGYLTPILMRSAVLLAPERVVREVIPDRPELLLAAAFRLYPRADADEKRRPFLEKSVALLGAKSPGLGPRELHVKALAHKALDQPEEAVQAYRELTAREPLRVAWHQELARYLYDLGRLEESRRELSVVLAQDPGHGPARQLLDTVMQELLQEKWDGGRRRRAGDKGAGGRKPPTSLGKRPRG